MVPLCPKCGCPPRYRTAVHIVKTEVFSDGGKLVVGKTRHTGEMLSGPTVKYECGGCHTWEEGVLSPSPNRKGDEP